MWFNDIFGSLDRNGFDFLSYEEKYKLVYDELEDLKLVQLLIDALNCGPTEVRREGLKWIRVLAAYCKKNKLKDPPISYSQFRVFCQDAVLNEYDKKIIAEIFDKMIEERKYHVTIIKNYGYEKKPVFDDSLYEKELNEVILLNPEEFEESKTDPKKLNWLVGQCMKRVPKGFDAQKFKRMIGEK